jgi:hypothetical protein
MWAGDSLEYNGGMEDCFDVAKMFIFCMDFGAWFTFCITPFFSPMFKFIPSYLPRTDDAACLMIIGWFPSSYTFSYSGSTPVDTLLF